MAIEAVEIDFSTWASTYGLLTSQRILERFNIHLTNDELITAIKSPNGVYYQLLRIPLKNLFNGIILQQAHDYQVYAQKLFIDYLLSGESGKDAEAPGASTRADLEEDRTQLMGIVEEFNKLELAQQTLIYESQASLIKLASTLGESLQITETKVGQLLQSKQIIKEDKLIQQAIRTALIDYEKIDSETLATSSPLWKKISRLIGAELNNEICQELAGLLIILADPILSIKNGLSSYLEQAKDMGISLRSFRSQFYDVILRVTERINLLPDYPINLLKEEENRSSLHFDAHIGGD